MKQLLLLSSLLFITVISFGQGWEKTFGGGDRDYGNSVQQTADGGYIITGAFGLLGNGDSDVYLIKTDSQGDTLWTKTFGGGDRDYGKSVQQTADGGYIITGAFGLLGNGDSDVYLIKTDSQGDTLWTKTFGGSYDDYGNSVQQTSDGGYIVAGFFDEGVWTGGCELGDGWILKLNQNGDTLWTKKFDNNGKCDCFNNIEISSDGGFIIIGDSYTSSGIGDIYLVKTDNQGIEEWHQIYSETSQEGNDVKQTTDGGYIIVGELQIPPIWEENVFLIKYNSQGDTLWTKTFGGGDSDYGNSVQQTSDGGYIFTGAYDYYGNGSVYLIKTDGQGNTLWINELDNPLVKLYPNPTSDQITIDIKGYNGVVNVEVYDLQGRLLETTTNTTVSLKKYPKGIYVLKVSYGEVTEEIRVVRD